MKRSEFQLKSRPLVSALFPAFVFLIVQASDTCAQVKPAATNMMTGMTCNGEVASPAKISLPIGKSTLLRLPEQVTNRTLGNPNVAQAMLVSPETLYLLGYRSAPPT